MSDAKFTKGNWEVCNDGISDDYEIRCYNCKTQLGAFDMPASKIANKYDAPLIAAAPEMFEMLCEWFDSGYLKRGDVEKLLAKAKGDSDD